MAPARTLDRCRAAPLGRSLALALALLWCLPQAALAERLTLGGSGGALGISRVLAGEFARRHPNISVEVLPSLGTGGGIKALLAGKIDLALATRPLEPAEREAGAAAVDFARTPFVFVTAANGAARSLRRSDLPAIYAGTLDQWPDGTPIRIILRPRNDSDTADLQRFVPGVAAPLAALYERPEIPVAYTNQDAKTMAAALPGSLATGNLASVLTEGDAVRPVAIDGVAPSAVSLGSGSYPWAKTLAAVTRANPGAAVRQYLDFLRMPDAAHILRTYGCVPLLGPE